ncbi:putative amidophosphoribosyltransferase [Parabacteroides sp. PFB2-10]|uniref:nitrous oxide-stimulated promoter family protein n=1 Tax=Parabacteroides sp. PFB2-10 TaxID=1742405 RepID=UPI0024746C5D|nr:nitrous oxide-stimulated promoter family protein [Parabacteroides sp. PFB2-10]MDH6312748.1 putative amidophosphoribosyltransferase [Parabacteroides sp. PFB2-10]MDL2245664.1 nitrous oxide-stimulated promoter family protein [Parabacteroides sp. OttesenSCG-928-J18]
MKQSRIEREKVTIERMVRIYCRKKEKNEQLCPECEVLIAYTHQRLDRCPYGEEKTACKHCPVHCYKPAMREKVRQVMRYIGPRMIYLAPADFIRHLFGK